MPDVKAVERLQAAGLLTKDGQRPRTTPRWQAALARAASSLQRSGAPWTDLRLPIAAALDERLPDLPVDDLADLVEAMLAVEEAELPPLLGSPEVPPGP